MKHLKKGFSLVEISIVLSIVGILIGFTMKGKGLLDLAKSRSVISQIENYRAAIQIFIDRYGGFPGDIADAKTVISTKAENGRADGEIRDLADVKRFWDHLLKSGLITATMPNGLPTTKLGGILLVHNDGDGKWIVLCEKGSQVGNIKGVLSEEVAKRIEQNMDNGDLGSGDVRGEEKSGKYSLEFKII